MRRERYPILQGVAESAWVGVRWPASAAAARNGRTVAADPMADPHPSPAAIRLDRPPGRILIVKPSALGDVVHALPIAELLRNRFPHARLSWLVAPAFAPIVEGHPCVDETIRFDRRGLSRGWATRGPAGVVGDLIAFGRTLADRNFDLVIDLQGLARSALLTWATGAPTRVGFGYARELAPLAYTHRVGWRGSERHAVERYLDVAEALGCGRGPVRFRFPVTDADRAIVADWLGESRPHAVLLPGTNWATKRWPIAHYAELAGRIEAELGLRVVVAGGADVVELARRLPGALDLTNRTTLPQLVALLGKAALVVANDSGPMHIASALGVPLVTIFGPTSPVRTGPYGRIETVIRADIACSPCLSRRCVHTSCMVELTPARVVAQARVALDAIVG